MCTAGTAGEVEALAPTLQPDYLPAGLRIANLLIPSVPQPMAFSQQLHHSATKRSMLAQFSCLLAEVLAGDDEPARTLAGTARRGPRSASSQFRGVTKHRRTKRWESHIWHQRQQRYLGGFSTEAHAGKAHDIMALKCRGCHGPLNFPLGTYGKLLPYLDRMSQDELVMALRQQNKSGRICIEAPASMPSTPSAESAHHAMVGSPSLPFGADQLMPSSRSPFEQQAAAHSPQAWSTSNSPFRSASAEMQGQNYLPASSAEESSALFSVSSAAEWEGNLYSLQAAHDFRAASGGGFQAASGEVSVKPEPSSAKELTVQDYSTYNNGYSPLSSPSTPSTSFASTFAQPPYLGCARLFHCANPDSLAALYGNPIGYDQGQSGGVPYPTSIQISTSETVTAQPAPQTAPEPFACDTSSFGSVDFAKLMSGGYNAPNSQEGAPRLQAKADSWMGDRDCLWDV